MTHLHPTRLGFLDTLRAEGHAVESICRDHRTVLSALNVLIPSRLLGRRGLHVPAVQPAVPTEGPYDAEATPVGLAPDRARVDAEQAGGIAGGEPVAALGHDPAP